MSHLFRLPISFFDQRFAGTVSEQGSYDELMEMKGMFYDLAKRQIE